MLTQLKLNFKESSSQITLVSFQSNTFKEKVFLRMWTGKNLTHEDQEENQ